MKILNLYAGIGGNRKLWEDVEVTAIENNEKIASIYQDFFPDDEVVICDAHQYLLEHYKEFDFVWSSPPCPSHSVAKFWANKEKVYPDTKLYEEILFLKNHSKKNRWVVENVIPYYKPLVPGQESGRHLFWANFYIRHIKCPQFPKDSIQKLQKLHGFNISKYKNLERTKILRNCVYPPLGLHILNESKIDFQQTLFGSK